MIIGAEPARAVRITVGALAAERGLERVGRAQRKQKPLRVIGREELKKKLAEDGVICVP